MTKYVKSKPLNIPCVSAPRAKGIVSKVVITLTNNDLDLDKEETIANELSNFCSYHYIIDSKGKVGSLVPEWDRAFSSGNANIDHSAIGILIKRAYVADDAEELEERNQSLIELLRYIKTRRKIEDFQYDDSKKQNLYIVSRNNKVRSMLSKTSLVYGELKTLINYNLYD